MFTILIKKNGAAPLITHPAAGQAADDTVCGCWVAAAGDTVCGVTGIQRRSVPAGMRSTSLNLDHFWITVAHVGSDDF